MSGQGISKRRRALPTRFRDGSALARADGRARDVRAVRDACAAIIEDQGGDACVSFLMRRAALRTAFLDQVLSRDEMAIAQGAEIDRNAYISAAQTWLRYVTQIGLQRRTRPVEDLHEYMRRRAAETSGGPSAP